MSMCIIDAASYQELSLILTALYITKAIQCFANWFRRFRQDTSLSESEKRLCLKVLALATVFWPIVLPLSAMEKRLCASPYEGAFRH
jgi:hypothetical protein